MPERYEVEFDARGKAFVVRDRQQHGQERARFTCTCEAFDDATRHAAKLSGKQDPPDSPKTFTPDEVARFLTVKEFAKAQGVSQSTVRLWVQRGLPHVRMGVLRIPPDAMQLLKDLQSRTSQEAYAIPDIETDISPNAAVGARR